MPPVLCFRKKCLDKVSRFYWGKLVILGNNGEKHLSYKRVIINTSDRVDEDLVYLFL